jgi:predicted acylesterase/phospholipase RssA
MTIKHLVISGGGPSIFQSLGAIQTLESNKYINVSDIESIYGTSAGAVLGFLISLNYDFETIYDFMIKRPWKDVFNMKIDNILAAYSKKGIFDEKTFVKCFRSLFDAKNIPLDITLKDYYNDFSKIELHFFTFDINKFAIEDVSYLTHPELKLLTAIQMSCCLPIIVSPVFIDNKCYIDGGIVCNYPLKYCIESGKLESEILGFKNEYTKKEVLIDQSSTLLEYIVNFLYKLIQNMNADNKNIYTITEIVLEANLMTLDTLKNTINDITVRKQLFEKGELAAKEFIAKINNVNNAN